MGRLEEVEVEDGAEVGVDYSEGSTSPEIGKGSTVRSGTVIYNDVIAGEGLKTGHDVLIREKTTIGKNVLIGTKTVLDGNIETGNQCSLQTGVYVSGHTVIGDGVFIGPKASLLNDRYPVRGGGELEGPKIADDVSIGGNATILPAVAVGEGAMVAAGAVVTKDIPEWHLAKGNPASFEPLPEELRVPNDI